MRRARAKGMAKWLKSLLCKPEDTSSNLQIPCKKPGTVTHSRNLSVLGEQRQMGLRDSLASQSRQSGEFKMSKRPYPKTRQRYIKKKNTKMAISGLYIWEHGLICTPHNFLKRKAETGGP